MSIKVEVEKPGEKKPRSLGLRIIAITKLISATLLIALGFGVFHLMGSDIGDTFEHFIHRLHLDPENKHITKMLADVSGVSRHQLEAIDAGTFFYALLYITEGVGLLLAKHWAEYLTIFATASLVPFELYEIARHVTALKTIVLAANVAIVFYLVYRLRADRRTTKAI